VAVYLVCEGFRQGFEERVLDALVVQFHNLPVLLAPAGGTGGISAVRAFLQDRQALDVAIEDRDYRPLAEAEAKWTNTAGKRFIWRRHEIENFLLHPQIVLGLFDGFRAASAAAWATKLPSSESDVSALLQNLARALLESHAAEVLRHELIKQINGIGSISFGPPRPSPAAGAHTPGHTQWLPALQHEATRLCQVCNAVAGMQELQPGAIATRYHALLAQFQTPTFLTSGDYLLEIGGHELLAAFSRHLHSLGAPAALSKQSVLADELLRVLERVYQPKSIYLPDDFTELAAILAQY
jgi:hypothetical protein